MTATIVKRAPLLGAMALLLLVTACTTSGDGVSSDNSGSDAQACATTTTAAVRSGTTRHRLDEYGVTFRLPDAFVQTPDENDVFVATSTDPKAVFTVSDLGSGMDQPEARDGETIERSTDGCREGFTMMNEAMDLPPGIVGNGLVVNNGDRSFVVSMSSNSDYLDPTWAAFVESLTIAPS